jgi:hypothetical protein
MSAALFIRADRMVLPGLGRLVTAQFIGALTSSSSLIELCNPRVRPFNLFPPRAPAAWAGREDPPPSPTQRATFPALRRGVSPRASSNTDAVKHFVHDMFPAIRQRLSDCRFVIAGSEPPDVVGRLASPEESYAMCRVFVVPLGFGAGISLKLIGGHEPGDPGGRHDGGRDRAGFSRTAARP